MLLTAETKNKTRIESVSLSSPLEIAFGVLAAGTSLLAFYRAFVRTREEHHFSQEQIEESKFRRDIVKQLRDDLAKKGLVDSNSVASLLVVDRVASLMTQIDTLEHLGSSKTPAEIEAPKHRMLNLDDMFD